MVLSVILGKLKTTSNSFLEYTLRVIFLAGLPELRHTLFTIARDDIVLLIAVVGKYVAV